MFIVRCLCSIESLLFSLKAYVLFVSVHAYYSPPSSCLFVLYLNTYDTKYLQVNYTISQTW